MIFYISMQGAQIGNYCVCACVYGSGILLATGEKVDIYTTNSDMHSHRHAFTDMHLLRHALTQTHTHTVSSALW